MGSFPVESSNIKFYSPNPGLLQSDSWKWINQEEMSLRLSILSWKEWSQVEGQIEIMAGLLLLQIR